MTACRASVLVVGPLRLRLLARARPPRALMRVMLGIPCLVVTQTSEWRQKAIGRTPQEMVTVDVEKQKVHLGDRVTWATVPTGREISS